MTAVLVSEGGILSVSAMVTVCYSSVYIAWSVYAVSCAGLEICLLACMIV